MMSDRAFDDEQERLDLELESDIIYDYCPECERAVEECICGDQKAMEVYRGPN